MSPETIARSVQRLNAAGVAWPTTRRVAITVRLAGLADVIALGDGVVGGPTAARAAVGHVLRVAGKEADPAAALREISKIQRVLSAMEPSEPGRPAAEPDPQAGPEVLVEPDPLVESDSLVEPVETEVATSRGTDRSTADPSTADRSTADRSTAGRTTGPRPMPVRPVPPVTDGPT